MTQTNATTSEDNIRLYYFPSTRNYRVKWLLEELGLEYEQKHVDLKRGEQRTPEYLAIHPLGKVPALQIGGTVIFESLAICLYLSDRFGYGTLAPAADAPERAAYYQWLALAGTTLEPAIIEQVRMQRAEESGLAAVDMGPILTPFERIAGYIESNLQGREFLLGDTFTSADIMVGTLLTWAENQGIFSSNGRTGAWLEQLRQRPAYLRTVSE